MHQDIFAGEWKQMRGDLKSWWGKLTDDDFERIEGQKDTLIGVVQEKYGYAREKAQQEVDRRLQEYGDKMSHPNGKGKREAAATGAGGPATAATEGVMATAATAVADGWKSVEGAMATTATAMAGGVESVQGAVSSAATAVAGGVESANTYLQEKTFDEMATDLTAVIRTYPVQSLLVGAALGYLFARLTAR